MWWPQIIGEMPWNAILAVMGIVVPPLGGIILNLYLKAKPKSREKIVNKDFTYVDIKDGIKCIVRWARDRDFKAIIGINRGGAIVGGIMGKHLGLAPVVLHVDAGYNVRNNVNLNIQDIPVLLVDDRLDDGRHMRSGYTFLSRKGARVSTVVFVRTENDKRDFDADCWAYKAVSREQLLPWEPRNGARRINFDSLGSERAEL